ncbi:MAG: hypothetical protein ABIM19_00935 [candidate division WOR-3 bacterium]
MKKLTYITGTMALLLALSCGKGGEEEAPDPMPLSVGNWWLFQGFPDTTRWSKDSIVAQEAFGSHPDAYKVVETGSDKWLGKLLRLPYTDTLWFFYDGDYFVVGSIIMGDTFELRFFKKNPAVGDSWFTRFIQSYDMDSDGTPDTAITRFNGSIVGQEDVTVPAGTFTDAYKAFYTILDSVWLSSLGSWDVQQDTMGWSYVALGIGPVKNTDPPDESTGSVLKAYEVK